jgi:hypothetical protein
MFWKLTRLLRYAIRRHFCGDLPDNRSIKFWEGYQSVASKLTLIAYRIQWVRKQKLIKYNQNITGQTEFHHGLISGLQAIVGTLSLCDVLFTMVRNTFHCLSEDVLNSCLHWWRIADTPQQHFRAGIAYAGVVTDFWAGRSGVRFLAAARDFSFLQSVQIIGAQPISCSVGTGIKRPGR